MHPAANRYQPIQERTGETITQPALADAVAAEENLVPRGLDEVPYSFIIETSRIEETAWAHYQDSSTWGTTPKIEKVEASDLLANAVFVPRPKVIRFPERPQPTYHFIALQKWEGTVTSVTDNEFVAVIHDLTDRSFPDEEATFSVEEVPDADRALIVPGAVFYWNVGYELTVSGQRKRVSTLRFRRLPAWTRSEIEAVRRKAETLKNLFGLHGESTAATGT